MKRFFTFIAVLFVAVGFAGCAEQSEISVETLPVKCVVSGHAYYSYTDPNGTLQKDVVVPVGSEVRVFFKLPSDENYSVTTVTTDPLGGFRVDLGCPVGQAYKIKCEISFLGTNYVKPKGSAYFAASEAIFYGQAAEKSVASGASGYFKVNAAVSSNLTYPDTNN